MRHSIRLELLVLVLALPLITVHAQTAAQSDAPQFHFPLEVGNVWVYVDYDYPFCRDSGCMMDRMEVVELQEMDGSFCGSITKTVSRTFYDANGQISSSVREGQVEFSLCQIQNRLYWYDAHGDLPQTHEERNMIADFDRDDHQPWLIAYDPSAQNYPYRLRRLFDRDLSRQVGPYGRIEYMFSNYLADDPLDLDGLSGGEFVSGKQDYFTSGIGFPALGWGFFFTRSLRGYYLNGVLTGDTTTVYATSIDQEWTDAPREAAISGVYPNPFNPKTVIGFRLSGDNGGSPVRVSVFDLQGREVAVLADGVMAPGPHSATFDATDLPSGVYVVVLRAGDASDRRMITLLK
jgi:hypothetical protein